MLHLKNFALIYDRGLRSVRLAPAYDIISTVVYDTHSRQMAFSIGGEFEWSHIDRACFSKACDEIRVSRRIFMKRFDDLCDIFEPALQKAADNMTETGFGEAKILAGRLLEKKGCPQSI